MILSVIVVNYKNEDMTISFVMNELSKISVEHNVLIVNNSVSDESDEKLADKLNAEIVYSTDKDENIRASRVYIIHNDTNAGFAKANNYGAVFAKNNFNTEYLLFTNNDIKFLDVNVVEALINKMACHQEIAIIGPKVVGLDGKLQSPEPYYSFYQRMILPYIKPLMRWKKDKIKSNYSELAEEGYHYKLMGSFFICNAKDYFACGMMDSHTFLYYEENILTERLRKIGKSAYYFPQVGVLHAHNQTIGKHTSFKQQRDYMFESGAYFYKTYKNVPSLCVYFAWVLKELSKIVGSIKRL